MSEYTKVTIKKEVAEQGKVQAAAQNRSLANYIEHLVLGEVGVSPTHTTEEKRKNI